MFRGAYKSTSALAIFAAAGFALGSVSAQAADFGGDCCADLEERVAELEATTVRKSNRKVSVTLYGSVSQTMLWWNDGAESNVYVVENQSVKNVLGVRGGAKINSDWSARYRLEMQVRTGRSSSANQLPRAVTEGEPFARYNVGRVTPRYAWIGLRSKTFGEISIGAQTAASIGTSSVTLVNPGGFSRPAGAGYAFQGFYLRRSGTTGSSKQSLSALKWHGGVFTRNGATIASYDRGPTQRSVKYTSPFFLGLSKKSGFLFSADYGMDDNWDVALRYVEDFGVFRFAAAVGYSHFGGTYIGECSNIAQDPARDSATDCQAWQASASIMHVPSGLFLSGGMAELKDKNRKRFAGMRTTVNPVATRNVNSTDSFWYVLGGWSAKLNTMGKTTFWGQYMETDYGYRVSARMAAGDALNSFGNVLADIGGSNATVWGLGISQRIDAAAMNVYIGYHNVSGDITLLNTDPNAAQVTRKANPIDDHQVIFSGATIRF